MSGWRRCCAGPSCGSAAYICVIDEAGGETPEQHADAVAQYCGFDEYSTDDPIDNTGYIHHLVSLAETGLPEYLDTGLALVGLEMMAHTPTAGDNPSFDGTDCHVLDAVRYYITPAETSDYSEPIIDQIEARFGSTQISGPGGVSINPHPSRIFFIIDNSGSYGLHAFVATYNAIKSHYTDAGMSSEAVDIRFGKVACCGSTAVPLQETAYGDIYAIEMYPFESWFLACVNQIKNHVTGI